MRRSTLIMFVLAVVMVGIFYYLSHRAQPANIAITPEATQEQISYLFNATDGQPTDIRIESKDGGVVELALDAKKAWTIVKPIEASAEQGSAEAAASQITAIQITNTLSSDVSPKDVGLDAPDYILTVKFNSNVERIVKIGVVTPTGNGYYVQSDHGIVVVSKYTLDALIQMITNPPYAQTLTPSPTVPPATLTPTPLPASPTPEAAGTSATPGVTTTP